MPNKGQSLEASPCGHHILLLLTSREVNYRWGAMVLQLQLPKNTSLSD